MASAIPTLAEAQAAKRDVWGEAAMKQPNGPSYEFFEKLLPPPRYVDAEFHYYPLLLSAPNAGVKAHLVSNGSGVNLRGLGHTWADFSASFHFRVGLDQFQFGGELHRLEHPILAEGYLPIFEIRYTHPSPVDNEAWLPLNQLTNVPVPSEIYRLEAFGGVDPNFASNGLAFVKFSLAQGTKGVVSVAVNARTSVKFAKGKLTDEKGNLLASFDDHWKSVSGGIQAQFGPDDSVTLAIATRRRKRSLIGNLCSAIRKSVACSYGRSTKNSRKTAPGPFCSTTALRPAGVQR